MKRCNQSLTSTDDHKFCSEINPEGWLYIDRSKRTSFKALPTLSLPSLKLISDWNLVYVTDGLMKTDANCSRWMMLKYWIVNRLILRRGILFCDGSLESELLIFCFVPNLSGVRRAPHSCFLVMTLYLYYFFYQRCVSTRFKENHWWKI